MDKGLIRPVVEDATHTVRCTNCGFATDLKVSEEFFSELMESQLAAINHKCAKPVLVSREHGR